MEFINSHLVVDNIKNLFWNKTFFRYTCVGILGTIIDVGVLALLVEMSGIDPRVSHYLFLFTTISFIAAVVNNFLLNKWWTFESTQKKKTQREFIKFVIVSIMGLLLSNVFMYLFVVLASIWYVAAKLLTSVFVLVWNFLGNKFWTFRAHKLERREFETPPDAIDFSIIIPAYNEEKRLAPSLDLFANFLKDFPYKTEILIVDDGSRDRTSAVANDYLVMHGLRGKVITLAENKGKGKAVKEGVMVARGRQILFTDADNSTPIEELENFQKEIGTADILIGSRYIVGSKIAIYQPWYRVMVGRIANLIIRSFLVDDIRDTQCGFKLFERKAALDVFSRMHINGFGFDMEALAVAEALGYTIRELPVSWYNSDDSRVRAVKDTLRTLKELMDIKLRLWTGGYR